RQPPARATPPGGGVTTDAPYRTTPEEIRHYRARGARSVEMEAAALFALGQVRRLPVCSAVVIDAVPDRPGRPSAAMPPARARCSGGCSPRPSSSSPRLVNDRG